MFTWNIDDLSGLNSIIIKHAYNNKNKNKNKLLKI